MTHPIPSARIVGTFDEMRPLDGPKTHKHGAVDYSERIGVRFAAVENGRLVYFAAFRPQTSGLWAPGELDQFFFKNYFYDTYGGIAALYGDSGRVYLYCHIYFSRMFNDYGATADWKYVEEKAEVRLPKHAMFTEETRVFEGDTIGVIGMAGFTKGPHLHLEIHRGNRWDKYEDRVDPEKLFKGAI